MKQITRRLPIGIALASIPRLALAHPGEHETMSNAQAIHHLLSEPDHLALLAALVVIAGLAVWGVLRARRDR